LIHQPASTAGALLRYVQRHPEYDIGSDGARRFLTTGPGGRCNEMCEAFWGEALDFEPVASAPLLV
jgi:glutamate racemase